MNGFYIDKKNFITYWLTKYVEADNEKTIYPAGSELIDQFGGDGAMTDVLTPNTDKGDNVVMMVYADQGVVSKLESAGLTRLSDDMSKIPTTKLLLKSSLLKESYNSLKEDNGIFKEL